MTAGLPPKAIGGGALGLSDCRRLALDSAASPRDVIAVRIAGHVAAQKESNDHRDTDHVAHSLPYVRVGDSSDESLLLIGHARQCLVCNDLQQTYRLQ